MNKRGNIVLSILLGVLAASMLGLTTDEILRNVYDSSNTALRINVVTGGASGTVTSTGTSPNLPVFTSATNIGNYAGTGACGAGTAITALSAAGVSTCTAFGSGSITGSGTAGLMPVWSSSSALGDSSCLPIPVTNDTVTGTTVNKLAKVKTSNGSAIITGAAETAGILGIVTGGAGLSGSAQVCMLGSASCVFDNATTNGHFVGVSSSVAGDCTDLGTNDYTTIAAGTTVLGTVTVTAAAGTRAMLLGTPDVQGQSGGGGNKNPAGVAGNLQTRGSGNQFAVFSATDDTVPVGNGTIHVATAVPNCTDSAGNHLNYTTATNAFSCGTSGGTASLVFPVTVSGTTTSGGIPYFSSTTVLTSSALLAASGIVIGGGAGTAPLTSTNFTFDPTNFRLKATNLTQSGAAYGVEFDIATANAAGPLGMFIDVTPQGSNATGPTAYEQHLEAGYTGSGLSRAAYLYNNTAGTGATLNATTNTAVVANVAAWMQANASTAGYNVGAYGVGQNSTVLNIGSWGWAAGNTVAGQHIGVLGSAGNSGATSKFANMALVGLLSNTLPTQGSTTSTALLLDGAGSNEIMAFNANTLNFVVSSTGAISQSAGVVTSGTITSSRTTDLGWSVVAGTNTACNTTCTSACVMGTDAVTGGFLACTDATADVCLCAGAS